MYREKSDYFDSNIKINYFTSKTFVILYHLTHSVNTNKLIHLLLKKIFIEIMRYHILCNIVTHILRTI